MRNFILIALLASLTSGVFAQNIIEREFSHYVDQENTTSVFVSGKVFEFASYIETDEPEFEEIKDFITTIESFNLIAVQDHPNPGDEYRAATKRVGSDYEELIRVTDKEGNITIYIDESNGVVTELVGIASGEKEFVVFSLYGRMDLNKVGEIAGKLQSDGFEQLSVIRDNEVSKVKIYPNPTNASEGFTLEVPESMDEGTATVFDMNGAKINSFPLRTGNQNIDTQGYSAGKYFVELQKDGVSIKKKLIIVQ